MQQNHSLEKRLTRAMGKAIGDFGMISEGDRILVAVSGGKDSHTLLYLLRELQKKSPVRFSLQVVNIDQGHPGYPADVLRDFMAREGYDFTLVREDTYSVVKEKIPEGKTYCSLCSRLRRGILYGIASDLGSTKIALGHHRDDVLVTFLLNLYFAGKLGSMPPVLVSDDAKHTVIRPLLYCAEEDIAAFATEKAFPILPCDLCGSQDNLQRRVISRMLAGLEAERPGTKAIMLAALRNVVPSHLLDTGLWSKLGLAAARASSTGPEASDMVPASELLRSLG